MNILHTSDWHLGKSLCGRRRHEEYEQFLNWLLTEIERQAIEVLIVAGDIFDSQTPSNMVQRMYYRFLQQVASGPCRHVVIIGGNHDSPSLLNAPRELLKHFQVHVIGSATQDPAEELLQLGGASGELELIVCAVPYLRDRDLRSAEGGESGDEKTVKLQLAIAEHYRRISTTAEEISKAQPRPVPILATGHLFAAGGSRVEGDGVRDLYVGSLVHVSNTTFPEPIDYLALGHLHTPQLVAGNPSRRYSGSPLQMSFQEAGRAKQVLIVRFNGRTPRVQEVAVPVFRPLHSLSGPLEQILEQLKNLSDQGRPAWVEILYQGSEPLPMLRTALEEAVAGSPVEVVRIVNRAVVQAILAQEPMETLDSLSEHEVFSRCLDACEIAAEERPQLTQLFQETMLALAEEDRHAG